MDQFGIYCALPRPSLPGSWSAEPRNETPWRVARSYDDHPAILVAFEGPSTREATSRRLANVLYLPPAAVEIVGEAGGQVGRMAVLECRSTDATLAQYFFRIVSTLLLDGAAADETVLESAIDAIIALFRAIQRPGERTVQGLWGELAIIAWSAEPKTALSAWHSNPRALHDFSAGNERLEVKTTTKGLREHAFRLEQLSRHGGAQTVVASLMLQEVDDGVGVTELVREIATRVGGGEPVRRLETIVAHSLGTGWRDADTVRFDVASAREGLRLYSAEVIPSVAIPVPAEVKDVSFVVDLSGTPNVDLGVVRERNALFRALLPIA